jgi:hypothetical protein
MPGLAGAIFRKNSFHSALRTETKSVVRKAEQNDYIVVTLKLFNSIASERGVDFLKTGLCIRGDLLAKFLSKRPHLTQQILDIQLEEKKLNHQELLRLLPDLAKVNLNIVRADD